MRRNLHFLLLIFYFGCTGKDPGPEPRSRDEIMREMGSLPALYLTKDGGKREAAGGQTCFVDQKTGKLFWMALECKNPKCPAKVESGKPHIFIMPEPGVFVNKKGELDFDSELEEEALRKAARGFLGCQKCVPLRQKQMLRSGRGAETQAEINQYAKYVAPHVLPETKKRERELEKEMVARVVWEKENAP